MDHVAAERGPAVVAEARPLRMLSLAAALVALLFNGCATRSAPRSFPAVSAASTEAAPGPRQALGIMLREDPPLPRDERANWDLWPGLDDRATPRPEGDHGAPGGTGEEHEHHHGG